MKMAGRERGKIAAVVEVIDDTFVTIDGNVRRRRCNIAHLDALPQKIKIGKKASSKDVKETLAKAGFEIMQATKPKKAAPKPEKKRKVVEKPKKEEKPKKKVVKKKPAPKKKAPAKKKPAAKKK